MNMLLLAPSNVYLARQVSTVRTKHLQMHSLAKRDRMLSAGKHFAQYVQLDLAVHI